MESKIASAEYTRYIICKMMGWGYETYNNQPEFFLEEILIFLNQESLREKNALKKANKPKDGYSLKR